MPPSASRAQGWKELLRRLPEGALGLCRAYTLLFLAVLPLVFLCFISEGKSLVWKTDGLDQHLKALLFYSQYLKCAAQALLHEGSLRLPGYSFALGYGSDIVTTLHYYVLGDPLALLCALVPKNRILSLYEALICLRLHLSGLAFILYSRHMGLREEGGKGFPPLALLAGSLVYAFSGFALYAGVRHPYFVNSMIYFPLILLGFERIMEGRRPTLFTALVFVAAVSNFYFFYMTALMTCLYVLSRAWTVLGPGRWREMAALLLRTALCAAAGALLACLVLLPQVHAFLDSTRRGHEVLHGALFSPWQYLRHLAALVLVKDPHSWTVMGYACPALAAVAALFVQKGRMERKLSFAGLSRMSLLPCCASLMNGLSYPANRWIWAYSLLIAHILVVKWRELQETTRRQRLLIALAVGLYLAFFLLQQAYKAGSEKVFVALVLAATLALVLRPGRPRGAFGPLLLSLVALNVAGLANIKYSPSLDGYAREFLERPQVEERLWDERALALARAAGEGGPGWRCSGSDVPRNFGAYSGLSGTDYFWSLENGSGASFRSGLELSDETIPFNYTGLDGSAALSTLAGVGLYLDSGPLPFGFEELPGRSLGGQSRLSLNRRALPLGYSFDRTLSEEVYEGLSPLEKREALLQRCVVKGGSGDRPPFSSRSLDFELLPGEGISLEGEILRVSRKNARLLLLFHGLPRSETFVRLRGLSYLGTPRDAAGAVESFRRDERAFYRSAFSGPDSVRVRLRAHDAAGGEARKGLALHTPRFTWHSGRKNFAASLGYGEAGKVCVSLDFEAPGVYLVEGLEVLCQPMEGYDAQVAALAEESLEDVDLHENPAFATDRVTGRISLAGEKRLLLSIPWSEGWSAEVDGRPSDLVRANGMFMALRLPPGEHEIELRYETPWLRAGTALSLIGALLWLFLELRWRRRGRRT